MTAATIRLAQEGDAEPLARLGAETFTSTFGRLYRAADLDKFLAANHSVETYRDLLANPEFGLWVAEKDRQPVGYAVAGPCSLPVPDMPRNAGELARLYLQEAAQGAGLGARLLDVAVDFLRETFEHVYLGVFRDNVVAQRLYQRRGFVKVHDYFYMVGDHADPEWIMKLER